MVSDDPASHPQTTLTRWYANHDLSFTDAMPFTSEHD